MNKKIEKTINKIRPINFKLTEKAQERLNNLTKPQGSLRKLEDFGRRIVGITGNISPEIKRKEDHGDSLDLSC